MNQFSEDTSYIPDQSRMRTLHVVLVEPSESRNIGAVARAMSNFGSSHLHLIAPQNLNLEQAQRVACAGETLVRQVMVHDTLETALRSVHSTIGFSARQGKNRPAELLPNFLQSLDENANSFYGAQDIALVFGPERTGLRAEHIGLCNHVLRIPTSAQNPSLNLAQAVLLVLYEFSKLEWPSIDQLPNLPPARGRDIQQLDALMHEVFLVSGFLRKGVPDHIPDLIRGMLRRIHPNEREMQILLGMFARIEKALMGKVPVLRDLSSSQSLAKPRLPK